MTDYSSQYLDYMKSNDWKRKRQERLQIDGNRCIMCGRSWNLEVHHIHYRSLGHENVLSDLCTLCKSCHQLIHNYYKRTR